jgi:serine/threonine-protein kinase
VSLAVGDKLGPYEILAPIGAGGMGEVYRARDTKLDRDVAIKILPAALAQHPDRLARFEREAKVLAALNHPNIAIIHSLEDRAIVMELVEGPTLADRITARAIPLDESLKIAAQIADALEAAHEKGVVHRDLKPANVKVREDGTVKVLDFGLATAVQSNTGERSDGANSPTLTMGATEVGVILGTASYMSPEQAAGKPVDRRADIWSFGVVLWEMLTGKRLFEGESVSHTLADVLRAEIDFGKLPRSTPSPISDLFKRCLDRDLKTRLRDIGEARIAIQRWLTNPAGVAETIVAPSRSHASFAGWVAAAVLAVVAAAASWGWWTATRPAANLLIRFNDDLGVEPVLTSNNGPALALSPDGRRLAYVSASEGGKTQLSLRLLESSKSTVLADTEGASAPFFSPDNHWIGFFADQKLKKISVEGGAAVTVCDVPSVRGGFWGEDGNILFSAGLRTPLSRVPSSGGTPRPATELQRGEGSHRFAQLLPEGEAFLFSASHDSNTGEDATIQVQSIKTGKRKTLIQGGYFGHYLATSNGAGYLIYVQRGTVFAAPMDLKRLEMTGPASPVIHDVTGRPVNGFVDLTFTPSGTVAYVAGSNTLTQSSLFWLDASGPPQPLPAPPANYDFLRVSPDGSRIALRISPGSGSGVNLSVYEWAQNRLTQLTFLKGFVSGLSTWTPDGKHIVFTTDSQDLSGPAYIGCEQMGPASRSACWRAKVYQHTRFRPTESAWPTITPGQISESGRWRWTCPIPSAPSPASPNHSSQRSSSCDTRRSHRTGDGSPTRRRNPDRLGFMSGLTLVPAASGRFRPPVASRPYGPGTGGNCFI